MPTPANPTALAQQARRSYAERLLGGMPAIVQAVEQGARAARSQRRRTRCIALKRRELLPDACRWPADAGCRACRDAARRSRPASCRRPASATCRSPAAVAKRALVDDDTIEHEILSSRLALAMMDRASWEFTDLRSRMNVLEGRDELDANDMLRPHVLARIVIVAWRAAPDSTLEAWRNLQPVLHDEFAHFVEEAYHETNRLLVERKVLPEVDLRPFIGGAPATARSERRRHRRRRRRDARHGRRRRSAGPAVARARSEVGEETRMMTRAAGLAHSPDQPEAIVGRLNRLIARQLPEFVDTSRARRRRRRA